MNNKISYVKLGLMMILGAFIGMTGNMIISFSGKGIKELGAGMEMLVHQKGLLIESILVFAVLAATVGIYIYLRRLWKKEESSEDEAADQYGEKFEYWVQIGIMISKVTEGVIVIFGCIVFPGKLVNITMEESIRYLLLSVLIIIGAAVNAVMQIMFYHLMQKRDPQKKGDPSSFSFSRKWLDSCDETEKLVIYQAGYKAFCGMQLLMIVGIVAAIFGKIEFGTGDFPLVLLGAMWIVGTLNYGIWKMKGLKKK